MAKSDFNALEATISGSYQTAAKDTINFENVKGFIPMTDLDVAAMHIRGRYAEMWVKGAVDEDGNKVYPDHVDLMKAVYIDNLEPATAQFSYVGRDIRVMTDLELQDLATAKDLRSIPLSKSEDIRGMRTKAYKAYSENILRIKVNEQDPDFNLMAMDEIIADGKVRKDTAPKVTNDDMFSLEQKLTDPSKTPKTGLTLTDLRQLLDEKKITYPPGATFDDLYFRLYGMQA